MEPNFNHRTVLGQYPNMEKSTTQIGKPERATQNRVSALFRDQLKYRYLGNRSDRPNNSNIKEDLVSAHLIQAGYTMTQISRAIYLLRVESKNPNRRLDDNNRAVYSIAHFLDAVTRPILRPVQKIIPPLGGVDISPIIVLLVIQGIRLYLLPLAFGPIIAVLH